MRRNSWKAVLHALQVIWMGIITQQLIKFNVIFLHMQPKWTFIDWRQPLFALRWLERFRYCKIHCKIGNSPLKWEVGLTQNMHCEITRQCARFYARYLYTVSTILLAIYLNKYICTDIYLSDIYHWWYFELFFEVSYVCRIQFSICRNLSKLWLQHEYAASLWNIF